MEQAKTNLLYFGDNLDVLRRHVKDESVDLIYLDPPFNSKRAYNVLFRSHGGAESAAQIQAFTDTWRWSPETDEQLDRILGGGAPSEVADAVNALRRMLDTSDMMAYLVMMVPRLIELRRVLKETGSIYLHCDPTASHYLKLLLDAIFGVTHFRSEISWKRASAHSDSKRYGANHDTILFYSKSKSWTWHRLFTPYTDAYLEQNYRYKDPDGRRFRVSDLTANKPGGDVSYKWTTPDGRVVKPYKGRFWAYSKKNMEEMHAAGKLYYRNTGMPMLKHYRDEMPGVPLQTFWDDIPPVISGSDERLGYATQKPLALLERIISASSSEGDVVLDPFCGCGTAIDAAQHLGRRWIGIDITYIAVDLIQKRLRHRYPEASYYTGGIPTDIEGARALFLARPFEFERWSVSKIDATPNEKQVGDRGVDGRVRFHADDQRRIGQVIVSVKGGEVINPSMLRDLVGTVERERAEMGILLTMTKPTPGILAAAAAAGSYKSPLTGQSYPKIQTLTIAELLAGKAPKMPTAIMPYIKATQTAGEQLTMQTQGHFRWPVPASEAGMVAEDGADYEVDDESET